MDCKKIARALLYPHFAWLFLLLPLSAAFLVCSMVFLGTESAVSIISYILAAYTLTVWCVRIPEIIAFFKKLRRENKYVIRWFEDTNLRINVGLAVSILTNGAFSVFQLCLGIYHGSFWFYSMAAYYISLAVMRFFLVRYTAKHTAGEEMSVELKKYRACGWIFLFMNLAVSLMIFFMVYWDRTFKHHEITTIAIAAFTFTSFTLAIIDIVRYRRYNSPVYSATKAISLASGAVSMLTLEATMLTTFDDGTMGVITRKILLGATGGAVSVFVVAMAIYMIVIANKKIKGQNCEVSENGE